MEHILIGLGFVLVGALCLIGIAASVLSLSGTWLVVAATVLSAILRYPSFPGIVTIIIFIVISILVEVMEFFAGLWGIQRRGGSTWTGVAAVIGGILGLMAGSFIPLPILGNLIGMLAGSFFLAFAVEYHRQQKTDQASHIAMGALIGHLIMVLVKVGVTLGMVAILVLGMILG